MVTSPRPQPWPSWLSMLIMLLSAAQWVGFIPPVVCTGPDLLFHELLWSAGSRRTAPR
jgi:hypothetical protein